jgi:coenzyme F420-reducing hydrogenase gamma subunit
MAGGNGNRTYLGVPVKRIKAAFFDFTGCEGCQLQLLNNEGSLLDFLSLVDIRAFREAMTGASDDYDVAFIEGSITRADEVKRLKSIREKAKVLVALGTCACFGGVNRLKDRFGDLEGVKRRVYGNSPVSTRKTRAADEVVTVDLKIPGCPVKKEEVEEIVTNVALGKSVELPRYPVCMECKARENVCLLELGEPCLGPVVRAGCDAWCPSGGTGCWGCRGPADDANIDELISIMTKRGISSRKILDRFECFGAFEQEAARLRTPENRAKTKARA